MEDNNVQQWLKQAHEAGLSNEQIRQQLITNGWSSEQIAELLYTPAARYANTYHPINQQAGLQSGPLNLVGSAGQSNTGQLVGIKELFSQTWNIFKSRLGQFVLLGLIFLVIEIVFYLITYFLVIGGMLGGIFTIFASDNQTIQYIIGFIVGFGMVAGIGVIGSFIFSWFYSAFLQSIHTHEQKIPLDIIMKQSFKLMLPVWWITIIIGFLVTGANALLVVGTIFGVWFCFAPFVRVVEGESGMNALLKSKEYVRNYWWAVFGRQMLFSLIIGALFTIITLISVPFNFTSNEMARGVGSWVTGILTMVVTPLIIPLYFCYLYAIYRNLLALKGPVSIAGQKKGKLILLPIIGYILMLIVLAMLIFGGLFVINTAKTHASDATRKSDIEQINLALILYYDDTQAYPGTLDALVPTYLPTTLRDPQDGSSYIYTLSNNAKNYTICATLKNKGSNGEKYCLNSTDYSMPPIQYNTTNTSNYNYNTNSNANTNINISLNTNSATVTQEVYSLGTLTNSVFTPTSSFTTASISSNNPAPILHISNGHYKNSMLAEIYDSTGKNDMLIGLGFTVQSVSQQDVSLSTTLKSLNPGSYELHCLNNSMLIASLPFTIQ
jgi:hypothetical protein